MVPDRQREVKAEDVPRSGVDQNCHSVSLQASAGSITISSFAWGAGGDYSLTFSSAGTLTGTFSAPPCSLNAAQFCALGTSTNCSG